VLACSFNNNDARDDTTNGINGVLTGVDVGKGKNGAALWFHTVAPVVAGGSTNESQTAASKSPLPAEQGDFSRGGQLSSGAGASTNGNASPGGTTVGRSNAQGNDPDGYSQGVSSIARPNTAARDAAITNADFSAFGGPGVQRGPDTYVKYDWNTYVPVSTTALSMSGTNLIVAGTPDLANEEDLFERLTKKDPAVQKDIDEQEASLEGRRGALVKIINKSSGEVARDFTLDSAPVWDGVSVAQGRIFIVTADGKIRCYGQPPKPPVLP
jgi:hypothetical protein